MIITILIHLLIGIICDYSPPLQRGARGRSLNTSAHRYKEDNDIVEEDNCQEEIHVGLPITCGSTLIGHIARSPHTLHKPLIEAIERPSYEDADKESNGNITKVMNTEIETSKRSGDGPEIKGNGDCPMTEKE